MWKYFKNEKNSHSLHSLSSSFLLFPHKTFSKNELQNGSFLKLKELKERQKQQLRQKAMKKGLDPE